MRGSCTCCSTTYISYLATKLQRYFLCESCFYNQKKKYHYLWFWKKMMLLMYITNLVKCRKKISLYRIWFHFIRISSVQFSRSVVSSSLPPHESQHTRPPCPSPTPGVHSDSRPSSPWCHPAISTSVVPFSSYPQSLPASESFPMSQLFAWGGQSTGVSASASFPPKKSRGWSPWGWTGWISLQSKGLSRVFSNTTVQKHQFSGTQLFQLYSVKISIIK